jgi:calcineurin-like phosphoesterase
MPMKMHLASGGVQVDGVVIDVDDATGKATAIERIQRPR